MIFAFFERSDRRLLTEYSRAAFDQLTSHHDFHDALHNSDGAVRALLERVAVEEPVDDDTHETLRSRLLVNAVAPVAGRLVADGLRSDDGGAGERKRDLDTLIHEREIGAWDPAREAAERLLRWIVREGGDE